MAISSAVQILEGHPMFKNLNGLVFAGLILVVIAALIIICLVLQGTFDEFWTNCLKFGVCALSMVAAGFFMVAQ